jgi:putative oxidoreductase
MNSLLPAALAGYARYVRVVSLLQHPLLFACRLYWGGLFVFTGFSKLSHLALTAERFAGWNIPAPYPNAVAAGTTELACGALLVIGAASRIVTVPLIVTMIVAYLTAHIDEVNDIYTFVTAPPFLHLFACLLVLVFGPGVASIDYLVGRFVFGLRCGPGQCSGATSMPADGGRSASADELQKGMPT